jgi:RHH-type proline utilization regulon transcriptional repressor/proline dehydrogenase/delta 1-pyrroline-5-carboxylate dehydrogenase
VAAGLVRLFAIEQSPITVHGVIVESDARWHERLQAGQAGVGGGTAGRIRLIGGSAKEVAKALAGDPDVAVYSGPVTTSGRIELLPFLAEQSISITAHRFGNPDSMMAIS